MIARYVVSCPCRTATGGCPTAVVGTADEVVHHMVDHVRRQHRYQDTPALRILIQAMLRRLPELPDGAPEAEQGPPSG